MSQATEKLHKAKAEVSQEAVETKASAKNVVQKAKRLSNEALMYKMVEEGKSKKQINAAFRKRYPDATKEFFAKRVRIYMSIADKQIASNAEA